VLVDDPTLYPLVALVRQPSALMLPYRSEFGLAVQRPERVADLIVTTNPTIYATRATSPIGTTDPVAYATRPTSPDLAAYATRSTSPLLTMTDPAATATRSGFTLSTTQSSQTPLADRDPSANAPLQASIPGYRLVTQAGQVALYERVPTASQ
jgi:hypothetical protein